MLLTVMSVATLLNEYWELILFVCLVLALFILAVLIFYVKFIKKENSFKENFASSKLLQIEIIINMEEEVVQKLYLYDQDHKDEIVSLNEFFMHFDHANYEKIKTWLDEIAVNDLSQATYRKEIVMYDSANIQGVYLVELENYDKNRKTYFLKFQDVTKSKKVNARLAKTSIVKADEVFFNKIMQRLSVSDYNVNSYIVTITYKELEFASKELPSGFFDSLQENIYQNIAKMKFDNELLALSLSSGLFILFSPNVVNAKKYAHHIKKILSVNSGVYNLANDSFTYNINLFAGYSKVKSGESDLSTIISKVYEAENALKTLVSKGHINERLRLYDESLQKQHKLENNKEMAIVDVITRELFETNLAPIINTDSKEVSGYYIDIIIPHALNMTLEDFMSLVVKSSYVVTFYTKIFEKILETNIEEPFYLTFDFQAIHDVMKAYGSNPAFKKINLYFCIEFSNNTMQKTDVITIEKTMTNCKRDYGVKFGIYYNTLTSIYLNEKIYLKAHIMILGGQLVQQALDKYSNESLISHYSDLAKHYHHELIGIDVDSIAIYEMLHHCAIKNIGGKILNQHVSNHKIIDKTLLKNLKEIENRNY